MRRTTAILLAAAALGCSGGDNTPAEETTQEKLDRIRALPYVGGTSGDSERSGVVVFDQKRTCPGYRLYTIQMLGRAELIDNAGNVVRVWRNGDDQRWERSELLPHGDLLVVGMDKHGWQDGVEKTEAIADDDRFVMRLDAASQVVWKKKLLAHHDVEVTPDGRVAVLTFRRVMKPEIDANVVTRDDHITLLDMDGNELESRSLLEPIMASRQVFPLGRVKPSKLGVEPWVDLLHSNSVEWMYREQLYDAHRIYGPNNVLVCFRHQSRVAIFDMRAGVVVWAWGRGEIIGPHDAQVLENGNVLLFDNGVTRDWSRALEVDPMTNRIVWEFKADPPESFYTQSKGSVQRLPNGNTLLAESDNGRVIEVTSAGEVVWEFLCPYPAAQYDRASIVRMVLYPEAQIDRMLERQ